MKNFILFAFILASCNVIFVKEKSNKPFSEKENVKGVLLYEYVFNGSSHIESNCYIIKNNTKTFFYDDSFRNSVILSKHPTLNKFGINDTTFINSYFEKDSMYNLGYCSYKKTSDNIGGFVLTTSPSIYKKNSTTSIFIAFNFQGLVIKYSGLNYNDNTQDFFVLLKLLRVNRLSENQEKKLELFKAKIDTIRSFFEE